MESTTTEKTTSQESEDLDPRIQIELEHLNTATDEINKLEIELEEANSTFRILLNESTRRLKLLSKKLGNCIEKARPYYDALEKAREAQIECQKAAATFQRANEIHAAAKETVALAEQRFMSNSHEWQFDNAWQEMLNHATLKVMDAETKKAESHAEHQRRTQIFNAAEMKVQQLEDRCKRSIQKSRPYFEEKQICQDQLQTQKNRIQELQQSVQDAKNQYSTALRNLEDISEEIHKKRGDLATAAPPGPREPGVGAERSEQLPDFKFELEKCDRLSLGNSELSLTTSCVSSGGGGNIIEGSGEPFSESNAPDLDEEYENVNNFTDNDEDDEDLEQLRQKVKTLAVRPVEGGDGQQDQDVWENELNATVNRLDHLMLMQECAAMSNKSQHKQIILKNSPSINNNIKLIDNNHHLKSSMPGTPEKSSKLIKGLRKSEPLPSINVSMRELPMLASISNEILDRSNYHKRRRSLD